MKRFCLILILLLILAALFAGCTEKSEETTARPAIPTAAVPEKTDANGASAPPETGLVKASADDLQTTSVITTEVPFSGMEIEDSYVETVGENVGIGGN